MVMHHNKAADTDDKTDEGTNEEHISIEKCTTLAELTY
jgi:hypothetical protein